VLGPRDLIDQFLDGTINYERLLTGADEFAAEGVEHTSSLLAVPESSYRSGRHAREVCLSV